MKVKVAEVFESVQGEGIFQGYPVLFVRLSNCTRKCDFCDTKYHTEGKETDIDYLARTIMESNLHKIVFTGGEPLLQLKAIKKLKALVEKDTYSKELHLETNGDLITDKNFKDIILTFDYICISPKELKVAERVSLLFDKHAEELPLYDIKVVTDMQTNREMIHYATMLMPLTSYNTKKDNSVRQKVWNYCVDNNLFYSARLHITVWGKQRYV